MKKHKEEYEETKKKIERFKDTGAFEEINKLHNQGVESTDPGEFSISLMGRYQLLQQLESMFKSSEDRIQLMTSEEGLKEIYNNHINHLQDAHERGVDVKIAAPVKGEAEDLVEKLSEFAEIKHIPENEEAMGRFSIVDGNEFTFALTDEDEVHPTQDVSFWSQSDHAAGDFLEPMFQQYWKRLERPGSN